MTQPSGSSYGWACHDCPEKGWENTFQKADEAGGRHLSRAHDGIGGFAIMPPLPDDLSGVRV